MELKSRLFFAYAVLVFLVQAAAPEALAQVSGERKVNRLDSGAIAYHRESKSFGYAVDKRTSREARTEALKQCGHEKCEVVLAFDNSCGALAAGGRKHFASRGATRAEAEAKSLRQCGKQCEVLVWACTK